ncbi:transposase domain-containing protein [Streptomyces sp. PA03-1a]|nr:transposase domain-containing protein [Streptomyces sp. PA03-1a]
MPSASALAQARRRIGAAPLRWLFDMKGPGADVRAAGTRCAACWWSRWTALPRPAGAPDVASRRRARRARRPCRRAAGRHRLRRPAGGKPAGPHDPDPRARANLCSGPPLEGRSAAQVVQVPRVSGRLLVSGDRRPGSRSE